MAQPTQTQLFLNKEQINDYKANHFIWHYFFDQHGLMLLDEHITEIVLKIDQYKSMKNNLTTATERPY